MERHPSPMETQSIGHTGADSGNSEQELPTTNSHGPTAPGGPTTPARPSLETLPVELQRLILSQVPGLPSLSALVHASPELHRVYVEDREPVLRSLLAQTLSGLLIDAIGVYRSGTEAFQRTRTEGSLWTFVEEQTARYHAAEDGSTAADHWTAELSADECIEIFRFYTSVIEPLTEPYARWALEELPSKPENQAAMRSLPVSDTEKRRIQRGLYRLQLFCNVCGSRGEGHSAPARFNANLDRLRFLSIWPAWEVEEILSVHEFVKDEFTDIFRQVAWDLNEEKNPKYSHIDITSVNEDLLLFSEDGFTNSRSLNAVLRHGPHLLAAAIKANNQGQLIEMIRAAIVSNLTDQLGRNDGWIESAIDDVHEAQAERRDSWPTRHDAAQNRRQKTLFEGDSLDSPPLAWVIYWQEEYSNLYGSDILDFRESFCRWGFVIWDATRLDSRARKMALGEYSLFGVDPREEFYDSDVRDSPL